MPIGILGARISNPDFVVSNFVPFALSPGQTSQQLFVYLTSKSNSNNENSQITLDILTNISKLSIPIQLFSGSVYFSLTNTSQPTSLSQKNQVFIRAGKIHLSSYKKFRFYITNTSPEPFQIQSILTPPEIDANISFGDYDYRRVISTPTPPFGSQQIELCFNFRGYNRNGQIDSSPRNDTIRVTGSTSIFKEIIINWQPIIGEIIPRANFSIPMLYGYKHYADFYITSTFNETLEFKGIIPTEFHYELTDSPETVILEPGKETFIGKLMILADQTILQQARLVTPLGNNPQLNPTDNDWEIIAATPAILAYDMSVYFNDSLLFNFLFTQFLGVKQYDNIYSQLNDTVVCNDLVDCSYKLSDDGKSEVYTVDKRDSKGYIVVK